MELISRPKPVRIARGSDLRCALDAELCVQRGAAGFVIPGIGSLSIACVRFAGRAEPAR